MIMTWVGTKPHVLLRKGWGFHIVGFWQGKSNISAPRVGGWISSRRRKARSGRSIVDSWTAASETKARNAPNIKSGSRAQVNVVPPLFTVHVGLSLKDKPYER